jgi:hypothetical protein
MGGLKLLTFKKYFSLLTLRNSLDIKIANHNTECPKKIVPFFLFFFLGAQCVESGVSCTDCY